MILTEKVTSVTRHNLLDGSLGPMSDLSGKFALTARQNCLSERKDSMREIKDLRVSIALLQGMLARTDVVPEQKDAVKMSVAQLKRLSRKRNLTREEVFHCIREVSERLWEAFGDSSIDGS